MFLSLIRTLFTLPIHSHCIMEYEYWQDCLIHFLGKSHLSYLLSQDRQIQAEGRVCPLDLAIQREFKELADLRNRPDIPNAIALIHF